MDLMHDFWSILGIRTNLAFGLSIRIDIMQNANVIPVAIGINKLLLTNVSPFFVNFEIETDLDQAFVLNTADLEQI